METRMGMRSATVGLLAGLVSHGAWAQEAQPRTPWGAPDLQGLWSNLTVTPLERPAAFSELSVTDAEAAAYERTSNADFAEATVDGVGGRQSEWWEYSPHMMRVDGKVRTSIIIAPANGLMPISDAGQAKVAQLMADNLDLFDDPESRPATERCLVGGSGATGVPIFAARYNNHYQLTQTPDHLVIAMELGQVRIIPISDAPPPPFPRWMGHSRGRWEGETLVVETSGFVPGDGFKLARPIWISDAARVTERFTRLSATQLLYDFTVDDPGAYTQAWRGQHVFDISQQRMFEYACHENNYSLSNILMAGRMRDKARP
jgi:hypothetical protein